MNKMNEMMSKVKMFGATLTEMDKVAERSETTVNVIKFLNLIDNGMDIMDAANETGISNMNTRDVLNEISSLMKTDN